MSDRVTNITGVSVDSGGVPQTAQSVLCALLVPGGATAYVTASGDGVTRTTFTVTTDGVTGAWTAPVLSPGDLTPAGCLWQFTEPGGRITTSPSFAYSGSPIPVTTWYTGVTALGKLKMFLVGLVSDAVADVGSLYTILINTATTWTGGIGAGRAVLPTASQPYTPDSNGNVSSYLIRQSELSTALTFYTITDTVTGAYYTFTVPTTYTNDQGVWLVGTTYAANVVVRDPATDVPYLSLQAGNIGHVPTATLGVWWAVYAGESITAHLTGISPPGQQVWTTANLAHDTVVPALVDSPVATPISLSDDLHNLFGDIGTASRTIATSAAIGAVADDTVYANAAGGAIAPTLPLASARRRRLYLIKTDNVATVTITATGGNLINGLATLVLAIQYQWAVLQSDGGTNWYAQTGAGTGGSIFGASGSSHASGLVPDPGAVAGTTRVLFEDGTWHLPPTGKANPLLNPTTADAQLWGRKYRLVSAQTIGFIGDSITAGIVQVGSTGIYNPASPTAPASVAATLTTAGDTIGASNQGVGGSTVGTWAPASTNLTNAYTAFAAAGVRHVQVMLGTNDASTLVAAATYAAGLAALVDDLVQHGYIVILTYSPATGGTTTNGYLVAYHPYIDALVNGVTVLAGDTAAYTYFLANPGLLGADLTHPTQAGYNALAALWSGAWSALGVVAGAGGPQVVAPVTVGAGLSMTPTGLGYTLATTVTGGGSGEILVEDGVSNPPVMLTLEDGSDFLYSG